MSANSRRTRPIEQIGDPHAVLLHRADGIDHAPDNSQPALGLARQLRRCARRLAGRARRVHRGLPQRVHAPREILQLALQALTLRSDHRDRAGAARRPDRERRRDLPPTAPSAHAKSRAAAPASPGRFSELDQIPDARLVTREQLLERGARARPPAPRSNANQRHQRTRPRRRRSAQPVSGLPRLNTSRIDIGLAILGQAPQTLSAASQRSPGSTVELWPVAPERLAVRARLDAARSGWPRNASTASPSERIGSRAGPRRRTGRSCGAHRRECVDSAATTRGATPAKRRATRRQPDHPPPSPSTTARPRSPAVLARLLPRPPAKAAAMTT